VWLFNISNLHDVRQGEKPVLVRSTTSKNGSSGGGGGSNSQRLQRL
jgi:hypothetical protein